MSMTRETPRQTLLQEKMEEYNKAKSGEMTIKIPPNPTDQLLQFQEIMEGIRHHTFYKPSTETMNVSQQQPIMIPYVVDELTSQIMKEYYSCVIDAFKGSFIQRLTILIRNEGFICETKGVHPFIITLPVSNS